MLKQDSSKNPNPLSSEERDILRRNIKKVKTSEEEDVLEIPSAAVLNDSNESSPVTMNEVGEEQDKKVGSSTDIEVEDNNQSEVNQYDQGNGNNQPEVNSRGIKLNPRKTEGSMATKKNPPPPRTNSSGRKNGKSPYEKVREHTVVISPSVNNKAVNPTQAQKSPSK
ncbi:uncharacterized protein G2W53_028969 [Senna tora]|uniref:Uncharacterized protein n=1 Tax=Senna tora TaxID=362788 RepID=A0A834W9A4_9FABA|nr:uncharacterized protein G2W53_028969 [Senna tora]